MTTPAPLTLPLRASFNPLIRPYLVISVAGVIAVSIVGLPFAVIWLCGVGQWWARHYFAKLECELSEKTLRYRKGILIQIEKTIPLENIQDVTFIEGPLLRHFQLATLKFETAGHTEGQANQLKLTGIIGAHEYRDAILAARDRLKQHAFSSVASAATSERPGSLQGIEQRLDTIIRLLESRS